MKTTKREAKTTSPTAIMLTEMLDRHPQVQQKDLASDLGIGSSGNIFSLFKHGTSKLPIKHIPGLCKLLNEDPKPLIQTALSEYFPDIVECLTYMNPEIIDRDEIRVVNYFRRSKEKTVTQLREDKVQELKSEAIKDGRLLSERELRRARDLQIKLSDDPKVANKILKVFETSFIEA